VEARPPPDVAYNLRKFAELLPEGHRDLRKRVRQWIDAQSISTDLRLAHDCVISAQRFRATGRDSLDLAVMSLMQSAVMGYSRALERHSNHRGKIGVKESFSAGQHEMHSKLCHLRDEALAHFGPAGTSDSWSADYALLLQTGIHWQPVVSSRRSLFDMSFVEPFLAHLAAVAELVEAVVEKRRVAFQTLFDERIELLEVGDALEASALSGGEMETFRCVFNTPREGRQIFKSRGD
jgi:hypothetical protein